MSMLKESEDLLGKSDDGGTIHQFLDEEFDSNSRRKEISLYRHNEVILTVEHGVTLGLLKLIYSSDQRLQGKLQGVRSRPSMDDQSPISSVILSDDRVLNQDEYELIVQDTPLSQTPLSQPLVGSTTISRHLNQQLMYDNDEPNTSTANTLSHSIFGKSGKKNQEFVCEYCHLPFVSKAKYIRHRRIHTDEKPYACVYCTETFTHHIELRKHREAEHMRDKTFKCNFCPKSFSTRAELQGHTWRHTGQKNHKCRICGKMFATKGNLKLHIDKHIGARKHKCPFCVQRFTSHSSLEGHMAKHTGMRSYKCRYCPKSFGQSGQLTSHERLHTGEKPFICEVCGKEFRLNSTRLAHEKRHSGAKPHICDTCGRSFSMPEHLRRHMKTHENRLDRLVPCPFCKKKIFAGRNMKKHLIRHKELNLTELQAKSISTSLKPDREMNERDMLEEDQRSNFSIQTGKASSKQSIVNCPDCTEEFKSMRKLLEHLADVHYQRELTPIERKELRLRHGFQKLHHCQFCTSYFLDQRLFKSHVITEHTEHADVLGISLKNVRGKGGCNNGLHKCPNCSLCFRLSSSLDDHIMKDHINTTIPVTGADVPTLQFRCWYCPKQFENPEGVVSHMTNAHESLDVLSKRVEMTDGLSDNDVTSSGVWSCPHCSVNLKSEEEYTKHLSTVHCPLSGENIPDMVSCDDGKNTGECVIEKYLNVTKVSKVTQPIKSCQSTSDNIDIDLNVEASSKEELSTKDVDRPSEKEIIYVEKEVFTSIEPKKYDSSTELKLSTSSKPFTAIEPMKEIDAELSGNNASKVVKNDDISVETSELRIKTPETLVTNINIEETSENITGNSNEANRTAVEDELSTYQNITEDATGDNSVPVSKENVLSTTAATGQLKKKKSKKKKRHKRRRSLDETTEPFQCWFCSVTFRSPEDAVSHMTNEHDDLDNLSRRVEITGLKTQAMSSSANTQTDERVIGAFEEVCEKRQISLSPMEDFKCLLCPRKLDSKEAYELHMMVHEATNNIQIDKSNAMSPIIALNTTSPPGMPDDDMVGNEPHEIRENIKSNRDLKTHFQTIKHNTIEKLPSKSSRPKKKLSSSNIGLGGNVRRCLHCSRVFCGKKALDVHIHKMHGKEFSQKHSSDLSSSPFTCWFCDENFTSPEAVVDHMTNSHENLDNLSKRVEDKNTASSPFNLTQNLHTNNNGTVNELEKKQFKHIQIAPQKHVIPITPMRSMTTNSQQLSSTEQSATSEAHQPPPGFKVSYALAYVPIFIPDKSDGDDEK